MSNCGSNSNKSLSDKAILTLLGSYFIFKPFYLWESGLPQIADIILITAIMLYVINSKLSVSFIKESRHFILINFIFAFYVLFINTLWSLILDGELSFFTTSAFYIYNFIVTATILTLYAKYGEQVYKTIYLSSLASIIFQFAIFLLSGGFAGSRAVAFFNNPNQLGYHSLLSLSILLFTSEKSSVNDNWLIVGIFSAAVLCLASLSKAAIISFAGILFYSIFLHIKNGIFTKKINKSFLILALLIITISAAYQYNYRMFRSNYLIESVKYRLSTIGQSGDDNLALRGYGRLLTHPQYLLFGAGEGVYSRFGLMIEVHSTPGNILMSYGIIGISMYIAILYCAYRKNRWKGLYLIIFITLYGLTHNGIRNTLFWVMIALIFCNNFKNEQIQN